MSFALVSSGSAAKPSYAETAEVEFATNTLSPKNWGIQVSTAVISQNTINQILTGGFEPAEGDARGQIYSLTISRVVHRFGTSPDSRFPTAHFEPYATLTLVDEKSSPLFPDYNIGVGFRAVRFPWDRWIATTLFMGVGFSYSEQVYRIDRVRHAGEDRSHLKLDWPIQLTLALPRWPHHQLVLFNDHQSGGHIFDEGGVNSVGIGYRYSF